MLSSIQSIPGHSRVLTQNNDLTVEAVDDLLNTQSGLKGSCGIMTKWLGRKTRPE
jgi:acetate kinase